MFSIVISEKGGGERRETFEQSQITVGRVQGNDLMLPKGNVSKRHCSLVLQDGRIVVTDQNSTNGTYVNRRRISASTVVRQGDRIYVGDFVLRIEEGPHGSPSGRPQPAAVAPSGVPGTPSGTPAQPSGLAPGSAAPPAAGGTALMSAAAPPPGGGPAPVSSGGAPAASQSVPPMPSGAPAVASVPPAVATSGSTGAPVVADGPQPVPAGSPRGTTQANPSASPPAASPPRPAQRPRPVPGRGGQAVANSEGLSHQDSPAAGRPANHEVQVDPAVVELAAAGRQVLERANLQREASQLNAIPDAALERRWKRHLSEAATALRHERKLPQGADAARLVEMVFEELAGLGPLRPLLEDETVTEISASGAGHLHAYRGAVFDGSVMPFCAPGSIELVTRRLLAEEGIQDDFTDMPVRHWLPKHGVELEALLGSLTPEGGVIHLRRRVRPQGDAEELVRAGTFSRVMVTFLRHCLAGRANVLVIGPRRSGATEVLAALRSLVAADRFLGVQERGNVGATTPNVVPIAIDPDTDDITDLIGMAARVPGHRLLVEQLQREAALATLTAISEGADGVLARLTAQGVDRGLSQLCAELALAHGRLTPQVVGEALQAGFDVAVEVARLPDGRSRVLRICELELDQQGKLGRHDIFEFLVERTATGGSIEGTFRSTGRTPKIAAGLRARGARIDSGLFTR